jgi:hypothetical protein
MIQKWFGLAALMLTAMTLLSLASCARSQKLVGISVKPATATFGGVGAQLQFKAIGTYIHPPENKDVTQQAKWSIDSQHLVTIDGPGLVTAIGDCGTGNVMASIQQGGNYVFSTAFVSAAGVGTSTCTQASLTVEVSGSGTVTSSPPAILCPGTCTAAFPLDSTVVLTAAPGAGASSVTWTWDPGSTGCSGQPSTTCSVALETNATISATFQ